MKQEGKFATYSKHYRETPEGHIFLNKEGACTISLEGAASMSQEELDGYGEIIAEALNKETSWDESQGSDICYRCGTAQPYRTMDDIDEADFAIFCAKCHPIAKAIKELEEIEKILDTNSVRTDWTDDEVSMETDFLYGKVNKLIKSLVDTK